MEIECKRCKALFEDKEPACPYCGAFFYKGAETQYMNQMEDVLDDMKDLKNQTDEIFIDQTKIQVKTHGKRMAKIIGITIFAAVVIWGMYFAKQTISDNAERKQFEFEEQNFAQLDYWYENEEFDRILDFENNLYAEDSELHIYNWKQYPFITQLRNYYDCTELAERIKNKEKWTAGDINIMMIAASELFHEKTINTGEYTERDLEYIGQYAQEVSDILQNTLKMSGEELIEFKENVKGKFGTDYDYCDEFAKVITERLGGKLR